ncbi:MAG: CDP-glycerol--glycerophosphate glycerophosphotransferase, partial [Actinomadura rubrobrunea]|nr:CDP-glycerol--glycerophosphate glycerophosphotransferase [Actinomadura rubrobrunea]
SGEFLAFVDGDDMLPPYALEYLLASLRETGADFATGNVHRFDGDGARQAPTLRRTFRDTVRRTHVTRHEDLLVDRMVINKLWRRSFWDAQGLEFPRGALHDDSLIAVTAHHLADAVDVLEAPVYLWRIHPGEDRSLTRSGPEGSLLEHRVQAVRAVGRFLLDRGMPEQKRLWDRVVLSDDLRLFLQALDEGDDAYRQRFLDLAGAYLRDCDPDIVGGLRAIERLKWHLVERRMLPELLEVLTFERSREMADAGVVRRGVRFYGDYPFLNDPRVGVPDHVYRLDEELQVRQKVDAVSWNGDRLVVEGRAKLRYLPPRKRWQQQLLAWLVSEDTGQRLPLRLSTVDRAGDDDGADWSGYRIVIDPAKLLGKGSSWHVELWIHNRGIFRREELSRPSAAARRLEARRVGEVWVRPEWAKGGRFVLRTGDDAVIVTDMRLADGTLELTCEAPTGLLWGSHLLATRWPGCAPRRYPLTRHPDGTGFTARMPMRDFEAPVPSPGFPAGSPEAAAFGDTTQWSVELVGSDGTRTPLILPEVSRLLRHE